MMKWKGKTSHAFEQEGISQEIVETVMANITMPYIFITQPYS